MDTAGKTDTHSNGMPTFAVMVNNWEAYFNQDIPLLRDYVWLTCLDYSDSAREIYRWQETMQALIKGYGEDHAVVKNFKAICTMVLDAMRGPSVYQKDAIYQLAAKLGIV